MTLARESKGEAGETTFAFHGPVLDQIKRSRSAKQMPPEATRMREMQK
jgi:hypothetical protein